MTIADIVRDAAGVLGCALVTYGVWAIYPPAGFIAAGVILCGLATFGGKS